MNKKLLYVLNITNKGWQVSLLVLLPFVQKDLHLSLIDIGFLSMTLTGFSILLAFFAGHINDYLGNRNVLMVSLICYLLTWIGFSFVSSHSLIFLYAVYAIAGIGNGLFDPIAGAVIAKLADEKKRGTEIGNFASVGDLGRIALTTVTTLLIGYISWRPTVIIFSGFTIIFLIMYLLSPKAKLAVHVEDEDITKIHPLHLLKTRAYFFSLLAGMCDSFSSSSLFIFLPFLLVPKGISINSTGFFTAFFFFGYFSGRLILGRLADKYGKAKLLIIGEICMALLIISLIYMNSFWLIMINIFLLGIFTRGTAPIIKAMVADSLNKKDFEKGYSLYSSVAKSSQAISRPSYAFIGNVFGIGSIFVVSSFVALLAIIPTFKYYKNHVDK